MASGVWLVLAVLIVFVASQKEKTTDENRPYKFGFNIQGYQHRKEEKDENGIINGEYGFITADGYYRITVYATDANGSFKIISMKNIYVGFPPEDPTTTPAPEILPGQKLNLKFGTTSTTAPASFGTSAPSFTPTIATTQTPTTQLGRGKEACAGCFLPTTTTRRPPFQQKNLQPPQNLAKPQPGFINTRQPSTPTQGERRPGNSYGQQTNRPQNQGGQSDTYPSSVNNSTRPNGFGTVNGNLPPGANNRGQPFRGSNGGVKQQGNLGSTPYNPVEINNRFNPDITAELPPTKPGAVQELSQPSPINSARPNAIGGINGGPNVSGKTPGQESDGLPPGVSEDDIMNLLYRFNYTVGFHGHHEDGYVSGNKKGDYFFDGRDGVERRVEYIANEFGYQPNITFIPLGDNDARRPKEETEKEFGLKGYEFKWFRNP